MSSNQTVHWRRHRPPNPSEVRDAATPRAEARITSRGFEFVVTLAALVLAHHPAELQISSRPRLRSACRTAVRRLRIGRVEDPPATRPAALDSKDLKDHLSDHRVDA